MAAPGDDRGPLGRLVQRTRGVRFRLVAYASLLLMAGIAISVFTMRQVLLVRLDARIDQELAQEVREFRSLAEGVDPQTGRPFGPRLRPLFDLYLERNVPTQGEELLTFDRRGFYRSKTLVPLEFELSAQRELVRRWSTLAGPESGQLDTPAGPAPYLAVPVEAARGVDGAFVVAIFTAAERDEIQEAVAVAGGVGLVVVLIGAAVAFLAAGRVLAPLRELTETARGIEERDLTRRIEVTGDDELAELGTTFNAMLDRLQAAFGSQRELIRDVGHELRTPITIVRGHLELLGDDPRERRETIDLVTDELDRMGRLINDLMTLARAERPDFLVREPIRLGSFTADVLAKARTLGERRWLLDTVGDGVVEADPDRLTQAIVNLADNAVKQTGPGDEIAIGARVERGCARLWVLDSGPGVDAEEQRRLFRRFARGASGRRYSGTGLGLAIVRAIAEAHGGRVEVENEPDGGARFEIVVPVKPNSESEAPA